MTDTAETHGETASVQEVFLAYRCRVVSASLRDEDAIKGLLYGRIQSCCSRTAVTGS